jgi:hypothetical protein
MTQITLGHQIVQPTIISLDQQLQRFNGWIELDRENETGG